MCLMKSSFEYLLFKEIKTKKKKEKVEEDKKRQEEQEKMEKDLNFLRSYLRVYLCLSKLKNTTKTGCENLSQQR